jgi:hypothetical protein
MGGEGGLRAPRQPFLPSQRAANVEFGDPDVLTIPARKLIASGAGGSNAGLGPKHRRGTAGAVSSGDRARAGAASVLTRHASAL